MQLRILLKNAQPHPNFDYDKKVFIKDGREEYMKEQQLKDYMMI